MTLQQLEYIVALDTYRHYVTASEKCFVTQPTLTMQVKKMEEELDVLIFDRTKKPLEPTAAGVEIIAKARQIIREVNHLKEFVTDEKESIAGTFRMGIIPTLAPYLLPAFLSDFNQKNPKTQLVIKEMQTAEIITALKNDSLDLGILVTPMQENTIREVVLFNEPFLLYHQKDDPVFSKKKDGISPEDISASDMLILDEGHCFREQALNICKKGKGKKRSFDYQSGSIETLKRLVRKGIGYTLVPELSIEKREKNNIKRFMEPQPVREVSIAVHNSFAKEKLIEELRKSIQSNIPESFSRPENFIRVKWR